MRIQAMWLAATAFGLIAGEAFGQQAAAVQLPTISSFSVNTTVSVPDRGSVLLGGVHRAASGRSEFGAPLLPLRNRSFGAERSASGMRVSVFIHDFEAMDEYLLSQPTRFRPRQARLAADRPRDVWQKRLENARAGSAGPLGMSVAELGAQHRRDEQMREEEARGWFERGQNAEAAGKANVARVYYQIAARRAEGGLKDQIAARLEAVTRPPAAKLARGRR